MTDWTPTHDLELQELLHDEAVLNLAREAKRLRQEERTARIASRAHRRLSAMDLPPSRIVLPGDPKEADLEAAPSRITGWLEAAAALAFILLLLQCWSAG